MSHKKYIFIDSEDNELNTQNNPVHIIFNNATGCNRTELLHFSLPNTFYNINETNNILEIDDSNDGNPSYETVTITPGQYTLSELMDEVETQLQTEFATASVDHDDIQNRITISDSLGATSFSLNFDVDNSIFRELGYTETTTAFATSHEADNPPNFEDHEIFIDVDWGNSYQSSSVANRSPSFIVPNDVNKNGVIMWVKNSYYPQILEFGNRRYLKEVRVHLRDSTGRLLENVSNWNMVLQCK